eukprot:comp22951_c0_seq1/m.36408 comp22951_c0_seq1/g.36408  ORF comp22951_c0_seq1/g.36408 comp22951_c0_seq1/m.36408 type:complete len:790 (-) comp22951_c0_seq1:743-3112(-)
MGWKKKRKGGKAGEPQPKKQRRDDRPEGGLDKRDENNWRNLEMRNALFEEYYKLQNIVSEEEWDAFLAILGRRLPSTFRITGTRSHADTIRQALEREYFPELENVQVEGESYQKPTALPWYPDKLAYHCELPRQTLRKNPLFQNFQKFLVNETDLGNISRQEAVSMIPPLLLDVKPGHKVLDMCAAPGSKTAQLIEMVHADDVPGSPTVTDGLVIANDLDNKRCHMLVHQVKRLQSPCLVVTNQNAAHFPTIYQPGPYGKRMPMLFDRVLCDVPCSGDGTMRKNPGAWRYWKPMLGPANHTLQLRIFTRGIQMLNVGGYIVYSTCSFHPVENEAVVAEILRKYAGKLELVDVSDRLPNLKRRPGLTDWKVMAVGEDNKWKMVESIDEVPEPQRKKYKKSMFAQPDLEELGIKKCVRVVPHDQDTGGFFIALLKKVAPCSNLDFRLQRAKQRAEAAASGQEAKNEEDDKEVEEDEKEIEEDDESGANPAGVSLEEGNVDENEGEAETKEVEEEEEEVADLTVKKGGGMKQKSLGPWRENPFVFMTDPGRESVLKLKDGQSMLDPIVDYYKLPADFPTQQLLVRTTEGKGRFIYLVSKAVCDLIMGNQDLGLRIINTGIKVFGRSEAEGVDVEFRLQQEGIQALGPFVKERTVKARFKDVVLLMAEQDGVKFEDLSEDLQMKLHTIGSGSIVLHFNPKDPWTDAEGCHTEEELLLCMWVGRRGIRPMVSMKECRSTLQIMLGSKKAEEIEQEAHAKRTARLRAKEQAKMEIDDADKTQQTEGSEAAEEETA